jgi:hypothetical protein
MHPITQGEAEPILSFMARNHLQSILPAGTITYENEGTRQESTIDLIFVAGVLANQVILCQVYDTDHGSDHKAISTYLDIQQVVREGTLMPKRDIFLLYVLATPFIRRPIVCRLGNDLKEASQLILNNPTA